MPGAAILPTGLTTAAHATLQALAKQPGMLQADLVKTIARTGVSIKAARQRINNLEVRRLLSKSGTGHQIALHITPLGRQRIGIGTSQAPAPNPGRDLTRWATQKPDGYGQPGQAAQATAQAAPESIAAHGRTAKPKHASSATTAPAAADAETPHARSATTLDLLGGKRTADHPPHIRDGAMDAYALPSLWGGRPVLPGRAHPVDTQSQC